MPPTGTSLTRSDLRRPLPGPGWPLRATRTPGDGSSPTPISPIHGRPTQPKRARNDRTGHRDRPGRGPHRRSGSRLTQPRSQPRHQPLLPPAELPGGTHPQGEGHAQPPSHPVRNHREFVAGVPGLVVHPEGGPSAAERENPAPAPQAAGLNPLSNRSSRSSSTTGRGGRKKYGDEIPVATPHPEEAGIRSP